jgi:thiosulfate/3-mercaptopyruvate sulfurtransferase
MAYEQSLVETDWLADHLQDEQLRLFDCTFFLARPRPAVGIAQTPQTGAERYWSEHIPGAAYIDVRRALATQAVHSLSFPTAERVAETMTGLGVDADTQVVLYDSQGGMWATRVWWILRAYGFDQAAVLNGGYAKWLAEERQTTTEAAAAHTGNFIAQPRSGMIATRAEVEAAMADEDTSLVNALGQPVYEGESAPYGRAGHIPTSVSVPSAATIDADTRTFLPDEELRALFGEAGATEAGRVITYCGGGIAASVDAFLLTRLGHENVAIYDGSLSEWCADPSLPLVTGSEAG